MGHGCHECGVPNGCICEDLEAKREKAREEARQKWIKETSWGANFGTARGVCFICTVATLRQDGICEACVDELYGRGRTHPPLASVDARRRIREAAAKAAAFAQKIEYDRENNAEPEVRTVIAGFEYPIVVTAGDIVELRINGQVVAEMRAEYFAMIMRSPFNG